MDPRLGGGQYSGCQKLELDVTAHGALRETSLYKGCPNECDCCHSTNQWHDLLQFLQSTHLPYVKMHPGTRSPLYVKYKPRYD